MGPGSGLQHGPWATNAGTCSTSGGCIGDGSCSACSTCVEKNTRGCARGWGWGVHENDATWRLVSGFPILLQTIKVMKKGEVQQAARFRDAGHYI